MADLRKEKETDLRDENGNIGNGSIQIPFSPEEERGVLKKIDCFILPMVRLGSPTLVSIPLTDGLDVLGILLPM